MNEDIAIDVRGLSKRYRRGVLGASSLSEAVMHLITRTEVLEGDERYFRALDDVSFTVRTGSVCGLVGANGSGKTTLMKVLSRITLPSEGEARLSGRVVSMLEAAGAFDPELIGLDNIYLSGAIMGLRDDEIDRRFDEIVGFADIGPVLDTQLKRYSSGMIARLAFAVVIHVDADILLLDEILAVSDKDFREKCTSAIRRLASRGRTFMFVSHNPDLVRSICDCAILMRRGRIECVGDVDTVVDAYGRAVRTHGHDGI